MKKLMMVLVVIFAVATVGFSSQLSPYALFGANSPSDLSLSMILYFGQYEPSTNFNYRIVDSLSPTCYSGNLHDTMLVENNGWGNTSFDQNGWTMMAWVRFDSRVTSNSEINHIPLITSTNEFKYLLSKNGSQLLFQIITGSASVDPDNAYPYTFKSDSFRCIFDNYFHLLSLGYDRSTGIYSAYMDGNLVSKKPAAEGVDTIKSFAGVEPVYYVGSYWLGSYLVPAGSFFAGTEVICKTITNTAHKKYYDTTILHAPIQPPSAIEKTTLAIAKTHLLTVSPNPVNNNTIIGFYSTTNEKTSIRLYSANGSLIKTLFSGNATGQGYLHLSCNNLATGIYVMELETKNHRETTKISILK